MSQICLHSENVSKFICNLSPLIWNGVISIRKKSGVVSSKKNYSLRSILFDAKMDISTATMCLDISILTPSNMNRRK
jgi:hypothetical protein